jgi:hypothetical protein
MPNEYYTGLAVGAGVVAALLARRNIAGVFNNEGTMSTMADVRGMASIPVPASPDFRAAFWAYFDSVSDQTFQVVKWGWFRFSLPLSVLEPVLVKLIGARPTTGTPFSGPRA